MRGDDQNQSPMFSYLSPEQRVPEDHPLREIRRMTDEALRKLSGRFSELYSPLGRRSIAPEKLLRALLLQFLYSPLGRRSIAPEKLLRALLLQVFFSVRSERLLMEQLNYNLL